MRDVEQKIREVDGTMAMEGMPLTEEDKSRLRSLLYGDISYEAAVTEILEKYSAKSAKSQ